jgi:hypothetical protein
MFTQAKAWAEFSWPFGLARSAWDNATPKSRPAGYGVIRAGVRRADSMIGVTKFQIRRLKTLRLYVFSAV